jgi:peptidoglycan hydrolase CwlO-like protein
MTGCSKFFFVLIILAPLAYVGASYYNGQDGIQNIKNLLGIGSEQTRVPSGDETTTDLQEQIEKLQKDVRYFEGEAERLKEELEACQQARN